MPEKGTEENLAQYSGGTTPLPRWCQVVKRSPGEGHPDPLVMIAHQGKNTAVCCSLSRSASRSYTTQPSSAHPAPSAVCIPALNLLPVPMFAPLAVQNRACAYAQASRYTCAGDQFPAHRQNVPGKLCHKGVTKVCRMPFSSAQQSSRPQLQATGKDKCLGPGSSARCLPRHTCCRLFCWWCRW